MTDLTKHASWEELSEQQKAIIERESPGEYPHTWLGLIDFWVNSNELGQQEESLRDRQIEWLGNECHLYASMCFALEMLLLSDHDDEDTEDLIDDIQTQLRQHIDALDYWKINGDDTFSGISWIQKETVKANGDMTDRLQGWRYFQDDAIEMYFKSIGWDLNAWCEEEERENVQTQRYDYVEQIKCSVWGYDKEHLAQNASNQEEGDQIIAKAIQLILKESNDEDITKDQKVELSILLDVLSNKNY